MQILEASLKSMFQQLGSSEGAVANPMGERGQVRKRHCEQHRQPLQAGKTGEGSTAIKNPGEMKGRSIPKVLAFCLAMITRREANPNYFLIIMPFAFCHTGDLEFKVD